MIKKFAYLSSLLMIVLTVSSTTSAEDRPRIEDLVEAPTEAIVDDLGSVKRARLTEEQAVAQLQYMMINGMKRVEDQLLERGSFKPIGMTLDPDGTFRKIRVDGQDEMPQAVAVEALVSALKGLASNRTQWAVGLMYVTGNMSESGELLRRIVVVTEHIAGWARVWHYPYLVENEQVKMGQPRIQVTQPVYFAN